MRLRTKPLILAFAFLASAVASATPVQETTLGIQQQKKSLLQSIDFSLEYTVRTDLNENTSPHEYDHAIELSLAKEVWDKYTAFASAGVEYMSLDGAITRSQSTDPYFTPRDWSVGLMTDFAFNDNNSLKVFATEDVLTSTDSRYFGFLSVTGARGTITTRIKNWVGIRQTLTANYILNRYRYAPVSSADGGIREGDILPDGLIGYSIGPTITLFKNLRLTAQLAVRATHYLDNTNLWGFGNSYSAAYAMGNVSFWASYLNRGYADRGETNLWFADQYRKLVAGGITLDF